MDLIFFKFQHSNFILYQSVGRPKCVDDNGYQVEEEVEKSKC